jgi:iron complex transport system ATP-binding protein
MELFSLHTINAGYKGRTVLHDINMTVTRGDFIGIVGANGSGKSTLLRVMTGLIAPSSGDIIFEGRPLSSLSNIQKADRFGTAFLHKDSLPSFTVKEYLKQRLFSKMLSDYADRTDIIQEQMAITEITHLADRNIRTLSAGEMQRASIAAALVQSREILFLDEPTAHLDIKHILSAEKLLEKLHKSGTTIIAVFHDINLAISLSTCIIGISKGRISCSSSPDAFIKNKEADTIFGITSSGAKNPFTEKPLLYFSDQSAGVESL